MARVLTGFRSGPSRKPVLLRMYNISNRDVNLIWLDYFGNETSYGLLKPKLIKNVHSYEGHPWLCRDAITKRLFFMNSKQLFIPTAIPNQDFNNEDNNPICVVISCPVMPLYDLGIDRVVECLPSTEVVPLLNLPHTLNDDLVIAWEKVHS